MEHDPRHKHIMYEHNLHLSQYYMVVSLLSNHISNLFESSSGITPPDGVVERKCLNPFITYREYNKLQNFTERISLQISIQCQTLSLITLAVVL